MKFKLITQRIIRKLLGLEDNDQLIKNGLRQANKNFRDIWDMIFRFLEVLENLWRKEGITEETIARWRKYVLVGITEQQVYAWMEKETKHIGYKETE